MWGVCAALGVLLVGMLDTVALAVVSAWRHPEPSQGALAQPSATDARTAHPIVLAHGMMGFDRTGQASYWPGLVEALQGLGAATHVTRMAAFQSSEVRGEQLLTQVVAIAASLPSGKVNLLGHSQGGHAVGYVAACRPDLVASVTAVASPVASSEFADWLDDRVRQGTWAASAILAVGERAGRFVNVASGADFHQDVRAALASLSSQGAADFNRRFPAGVPN